jgi:Ser/Thr protein kinase RdoA (MazF antagonist)
MQRRFDMQLGAAASADLRAAIGPYSVIRSASWSHGQAAVHEIAAGDRRYFLKQHRRPDRFLQEEAAYRDIEVAGIADTPRLVWSEPELSAMVVTAVEGTVRDEETWHRPEQAPRFFQLGQALARFHSLPLSPQYPQHPFGRDDLEQLAGAAIARAAGVADQAEIVAVSGLVSDWPYDELPRVRCHGDFGPRNWCDGSGQDAVRLIDFERSDNSIWFADLFTLWRFGWLDDPATATPLFRGYGRTLAPAELTALRCFAAVKCLDTIAWCHETDQLAFAKECRAALAVAVGP